MSCCISCFNLPTRSTGISNQDFTQVGKWFKYFLNTWVVLYNQNMRVSIYGLFRLRAPGRPFIAYDPGMTRDALAYHGCAELFQVLNYIIIVSFFFSIKYICYIVF